MEVKIDFKWTQMDANGMFRMSAERHEIIITGWHITRKTIKSLKKTVKRDRKPVWEESSLYNQKQNDSEKAQRFESHWHNHFFFFVGETISKHALSLVNLLFSDN